MFTFHWSELLVVVIGGLILLLGLALVMLRRRNEILQVFLTPEEPNIEEEFFRVRETKQKESLAEEDMSETETAEEVPSEHAVRWGTETSE